MIKILFKRFVKKMCFSSNDNDAILSIYLQGMKEWGDYLGSKWMM